MSITFYASKQEIGAKQIDYIRGLDGPNWAYGNAMLIFGILRLHFDQEDGLTGIVPIAVARRAAIRARSVGDRKVQQFVRPTEKWGGIDGCRVIECGLDEEGIRYRLNAFAEFVDRATEAGAKTVYWA